MKCAAWSERRRRPCRLAALPGAELCWYHAEREAQGERVARARPDGSGPDLAAQHSVADRPDHALALAEAPAPEDEPVAAPAPESAPAPEASAADRLAELARLDDLVRARLGAVPEDPAAADAAAAEASAPAAAAEGGPAAVGASLASGWTAERAADLVARISPLLEAAGKRPLSRAEVRDGGEVLAPVVQRWLASIPPDSPYLPLAAWAALTFGPRFGAEMVGGGRAVLGWLLGLLRRGRPAREAAPVPEVQAVPAPEAVGGGVSEGWGRWQA